MKLAELTWPEVESVSREVVVVIPTGSLEQHGLHLPLFTDTLIVTAVAESVERQLGEQVVLTPTLWLGASGHHLDFPGSLSSDFDSYVGAISSVVESLIPHGFVRFYVLNGHGGNQDPNGIAIRTLKQKFPMLTLGHSGYYAFCEEAVAKILTGPLKTMAHACEAETSLMLHLQPGLVHLDRAKDDGLKSEPPLKGVIHTFREMTEHGAFGFPSYATAEKGEVIFKAAVSGVVQELRAIAEGYALLGPAL